MNLGFTKKNRKVHSLSEYLVSLALRLKNFTPDLKFSTSKQYVMLVTFRNWAGREGGRKGLQARYSQEGHMEGSRQQPADIKTPLYPGLSV